MPLLFKLLLSSEQKDNPSITTLGDCGGDDNGNRRHQRVSKVVVSRKLWHELSAPPLTLSVVSATLAPYWEEKVGSMKTA